MAAQKQIDDDSGVPNLQAVARADCRDNPLRIYGEIERLSVAGAQ
jgi:hypothetical protein